MTDRFNPMPLDAAGDLRRQIDDLRRELREGLAAHTLEAATIGKGGLTVRGGQIVVQDALGATLATLDATGLLVSGTSTVSGSIQSANYVAGTSGWRGDGTGFEFNPAVGSVARTSATNFALTTTYVTFASTTVTVPSGFTRCQVTLFAQMFSYNPNSTGGSNSAGGDALYVKANFNGALTTATPTGVSGSGGYATTYGGDAFIFTGLTPGSSLVLSVRGATGYQSIAADTGNYIAVSASMLWSH